MEDPQLSSYPLKVATLHYAEEKNDQQNHGLYVDALKILRTIDDHQNGHSTLRSFTIANEPMFKEQDKSHLQVRRLAAPLRDIESEIFTVGLINTLLLCVPLTVTLLNLIYGNSQSLIYLLLILMLKLTVMPIFYICVVLWLSCKKCCGKESVGIQYKSKILYKSTTWPLYLHSVLFLLDILWPIVFLFTPFDISWCELSIMLCFVIGVLVATRCRLIKCRWQWIFMGSICRKTASRKRLNRFFNQLVSSIFRFT